MPLFKTDGVFRVDRGDLSGLSFLLELEVEERKWTASYSEGNAVYKLI